MTTLRGTSFNLLKLPYYSLAFYYTMRNSKPFKGAAFYYEVKILKCPVRVGIFMTSLLCPNFFSTPTNEYLYTGSTINSYSVGCTGYAYTNKKRYSIDFIKENDIVSILLTRKTVEFFLNGNLLKNFDLLECTCLENHEIKIFGEASVTNDNSVEFLYTHFAYETKIRLNTLKK